MSSDPWKSPSPPPKHGAINLQAVTQTRAQPPLQVRGDPGTADYVPSCAGEEALFLILDMMLAAAVTSWPYWNTDGQGGNVPWTAIFDFMWGALRIAARGGF